MAAFRRIGTVLLGTTGVLAAVAALAVPASGYGALFPVIAVSTSVVQPGGSLTVQGDNFTTHTAVAISLHSAAVQLATVTTGANGDFSTRITVPADEPPGVHTIEALDIADGNFASAIITVVAIPIGIGPPPVPPGGGIAGTGIAVAGLLTLGLVLLVSGKVLTRAGRRRDVRV